MKQHPTALGLQCHNAETLMRLREIMRKEFDVALVGVPLCGENCRLLVVTYGHRPPAKAVINNYSMFLRGALAALYHVADVTTL